MRKKAIYLPLILLLCGMLALYLFVNRGQKDQQAPTISFSDGLLELSVQDSREALMQGISARDNIDGDVTDSVVVASVKLTGDDGSIEVTYAVFDKAGNVSKAVRAAKYTDYQSPRFSLKQSLTFASNIEVDMFKIVKAMDVVDGDISHRVRVASMESSLDSGVGTYQVQLTVSNSLGETVSLEVPVEVYAIGSYEATLTLTDYLVYLPAGSKLDTASYMNEYIRGNVKHSLQNNIPEDCSVEIKSNVQLDVPGVYAVEYRVTQTVGAGSAATGYTGYAKLLVVVEG